MTKGWNPERKAFVQHYASEVLDSSLLRMSRVGFVAPQDPMWASTLRAMDGARVTAASSTATTPARRQMVCPAPGTFSLCSFMYVDALARAGRLEDARLAFEKMLTYANHVGLFSAAGVGTAKILPSWLAPITTAEPVRYPASTGVESNRAGTVVRQVGRIGQDAVRSSRPGPRARCAHVHSSPALLPPSTLPTMDRRPQGCTTSGG